VILEAAAIPGVFTVGLRPAHDERGFFARTLDSDVFARYGLAAHYPQHSIAFNQKRGTLRGLHYQIGSLAEEKVVRCTRGAAFDVIVDLRKNSTTFGRWMSVLLDDANRLAVYIPAGCAHGYQTLQDDTEMLYAISKPYDASAARGIYYGDAALNVSWPLDVSALSARDAGFPPLSEAQLP
jgi:dTDP-4-dehydrorhamnose 3,5-epimerase